MNGNKEIVAKSKDAFLSLPEEEIFKYLTIFKQTLSGTIGKNLINMEFPLEQEMPGGTQEFLLKLRNAYFVNGIRERITTVLEILDNCLFMVNNGYITKEIYAINSYLFES